MKQENQILSGMRKRDDEGFLFLETVFHKVMNVGLTPLFFLAFFLFSFISHPSLAQIARPNVNDTEGWEKCDISHLTGDWDDNRKMIWCYTGDGKGDQKKYVGAYVVRADSDGYAVIWADATGIHFFDKFSNKVITPFDLSSFNFISPIVGYRFLSDSSLSYFYVGWGDTRIEKVKVGKGKYEDVTGIFYQALLDMQGKTLWKKTNTIPSQPDFSTGLSVSPDGYLIAASDDGDETDLSSFEIWDRSGKKVANLPGVVRKFSWSSDGKNIKCEWYLPHHKGPRKKIERKISVYDREGNWISGDK